MPKQRCEAFILRDVQIGGGAYMEPVSVLRTVEGLVFEVALWPRALMIMGWKALCRSWSVWTYITNEWQRDEKLRFGTSISPLMFWLLVVVLPYSLLLDRYAASAS